MQVIKDAVTNLMNSYGNSLVKVMLVDFDSSATVKSVGSQVWLTKDQVTGQLTSISSGGSTDYDDAFCKRFGTIMGHRLPLITPLYSSFRMECPVRLMRQLTPQSANDWTNFLTQKGIDGAYAVGLAQPA